MTASRKSKRAEFAVSISLSPSQVEEVIRSVKPSRAPGYLSVIMTLLGRAEKMLPAENDRRASRSLLRGLAILACFGADDEELGLMEIASRLEISPSTIHRYVFTLVQVGLLKQSPETRKYSLTTET